MVNESRVSFLRGCGVGRGLESRGYPFVWGLLGTFFRMFPSSDRSSCANGECGVISHNLGSLSHPKS